MRIINKIIGRIIISRNLLLFVFYAKHALNFCSFEEEEGALKCALQFRL